MSAKILKFGSACFAAAIAAACGPVGSSSPPPPQTGGGRPPSRPVASEPATSLSAAEYLSRAGSLDLFEIRSSEMALQRSSNTRIRDFARTMIDAHKGTSAQLSFAGRRLNLLPAAELRPEHRAMLDGLQASVDFDRTYRDQQGIVHDAALKLHGDYAARGSSPTLRPVAGSALAIVRRHRAMLGSIR